jgi:AraC-like DNA-binding protein
MRSEIGGPCRIHIQRKDVVVARPNRRHAHDRHELLVLLAGTVDYRIGGTRYRLRRGDCLAIRPDEAHGYEPLGETRYDRITVRFDPAPLTALAAPRPAPLAVFTGRLAGEGNRIPFNNRETHRVVALAETLTKADGPLPALHGLLSILLLAESAIARLGHQGERAAVGPLVARVLETVEGGLADADLRLATVAAVHRVAPTYLSRVFHAEVGKPFREHVLHRRMALAKHLLRGGANVTEACLGAGFNDYPNFIRRFRQRFGRPPGTFRRQDHIQT